MEITNGEITMTVKEFISVDISVDVYDDVCEELGIAFEGPQGLTDEGLKEFSDVLEYTVTLDTKYYTAIVHVDDPDDKVWEHRLKRAKKFFYSAAGYCSCSNYDRWFKGEE